MPVMPVKSVPGCLVTMAPSVIGEPVAFWPLPRPHLLVGALLVVAVDPPPPPPLPHAAPSSARELMTAASANAGRDRGGPELVLIRLSWEILKAPRKRGVDGGSLESLRRRYR